MVSTRSEMARAAEAESEGFTLLRKRRSEGAPSLKPMPKAERRPRAPVLALPHPPLEGVAQEVLLAPGGHARGHPALSAAISPPRTVGAPDARPAGGGGG